MIHRLVDLVRFWVNLNTSQLVCDRLFTIRDEIVSNYLPGLYTCYIWSKGSKRHDVVLKLTVAMGWKGVLVSEYSYLGSVIWNKIHQSTQENPRTCLDQSLL